MHHCALKRPFVHAGPEVLAELGAAAPSNSLASSRDASKHELKNSMSPVQNFRHSVDFKFMGSNPAYSGDHAGPENFSELGVVAPSKSFSSS